MKNTPQELYNKILKNKIITICILFTFFTVFDTTIILLGLYPPKEGINTYIHLLGRLALMTVLIFAIYLFDVLKKKIKSTIIIYIVTFGITWFMLFVYLKINGLFSELHPDAVYYMTRSYAGLYLIFGVAYLIYSLIKRKMSKE